MTYSVPYSFVPGTKAKADEVNTNFISVLNDIKTTNDNLTSTSDLLNKTVTDLKEIADNVTEIQTNIDRTNKEEFDGQWVGSAITISTSTASGNKSIDLTNYLPDDNYNYEILINGYAYNASSTCHAYLYSSIVPSIASYFLFVGQNSSRSSNSTIIPIGKDRKLYNVIVGDFNILTLTALAYRRIGSNL